MSKKTPNKTPAAAPKAVEAEAPILTVEEIAKAFRRHREDRGLSYQALAEILMVHPTQIVRAERNLGGSVRILSKLVRWHNLPGITLTEVYRAKAEAAEAAEQE